MKIWDLFSVESALWLLQVCPKLVDGYPEHIFCKASNTIQRIALHLILVTVVVTSPNLTFTYASSP